MVVLDVIHTIQATQAGDLAVRWNCKAGKCGSCSAEINGKPRLMCMTRMNTFDARRDRSPSRRMKTFPLIRDLVTDVSFNYAKAKTIPAFRPEAARRPTARGGCSRRTSSASRSSASASSASSARTSATSSATTRRTSRRSPGRASSCGSPSSRCTRSTPTTAPELIKLKAGLGFCNITKCCTEVCPEHIHITDNAIIPLKERIVTEYYDPVVWLWRKLTGKS